MATLIDDIFELIKTAVIVFLILGVWACAHKIKDIETKQNDKSLITRIESDESKIMASATRVTNMENENEILRNKIRDMDIALFLVTNKQIEVPSSVVITGAVDDLIQ